MISPKVSDGRAVTEGQFFNMVRIMVSLQSLPEAPGGC